MSAELIKLVNTPVSPEAETMLETLIDIMHLVRIGQITDIAIAATTIDDDIHTNWAGSTTRLIGPAEILAARLMADVLEDD